MSAQDPIDLLRPRPAAAVFDNDGLLLDTEEAWSRAEVRLFDALGHTFTIQHKRQIIGVALEEAAALLEGWLGRPGEGGELMERLHVMVMEEAHGEVAARPGAIELLDRLDEAGIPFAMASNSPRDFIEVVLESAGLPQARFQTIVSGHEVPRPKPHPDVYLEACRQLGVEPADTVGLEDSPTGVRAADAAGLFVIGVPYLAGTVLEGADLVAESLGDAAVLSAFGLTLAA